METITKEKKLITSFRSLNEEEQKEILNFISFLKLKKRPQRDWEDIIGVAEFQPDASQNHDKYLGENI